MAATTSSDIAAERQLRVRAVRDRELLRRFMSRDPLFAAYALADTDDAEFARTRFGVAFDDGDPVALVMEYKGVSPQPIFTMGDADGISAVLRDVVRARVAYLQAKPEVMPAIRDHYRADTAAPMVRMSVDRTSFRPVLGEAVRLDQADTQHLNRLYELGLTSWLPAEAVGAGIYYGVRRGTRLIAAAGTHVISPQTSIAAVGNVYTNREYRGQGHAKVVTSAVTTELLRRVDSVVLNVRADNPPALAAYAALGYREHTRFEERLVHRHTSLWDSIVGPVRAYLSDLRRNG